MSDKIKPNQVIIDVEKKKCKYALLIERHSKDLYKLALWMCKDKAMAEDVMQETYLRAWKSLDKLRDDAASKGWLFTIFRREYLRQFERKQLKYEVVETLDQIENKQAMGYDNRPEAFALRQALSKLPAEYREPLELQVLGGFNCQEIAKIMNTSASAIMTRLYRARQKMRVFLEGKPQVDIKADIKTGD